MNGSNLQFVAALVKIVEVCGDLTLVWNFVFSETRFGRILELGREFSELGHQLGQFF